MVSGDWFPLMEGFRAIFLMVVSLKKQKKISLFIQQKAIR